VPEKTEPSSTHENLVKVARMVPEISSRTNRQTYIDTHIHTQTYSSQYIASAAVSEVIIANKGQIQILLL